MITDMAWSIAFASYIAISVCLFFADVEVIEPTSSTLLQG